MDESGLSQRPHRCRTWAPRGQTPVLQYNFNWKSLSVAAGLTVWDFYFRLYPGAVKKAQVLDFLQALVRHLRLPLLVVWDRLPGAPQSTDSGLHRQSARLDSPRIPPSLRAGTEPRGIHLGSLEATRTAQRLPQGLLPTQRSRAPHFAPHAPPPPTDHRLLAASFFVAGMTLYYARVNKSASRSSVWSMAAIRSGSAS